MNFEITEKELLSIKAVRYGCASNKRLIMSNFVTGIGTESEQSIGFGEALNIVGDLLKRLEEVRNE